MFCLPLGVGYRPGLVMSLRKDQRSWQNAQDPRLKICDHLVK